MMKALPTLALAALLGGAAALATAADTGATAATPAATSTKPMSSKECNKAADDKKLTGDARTTFVKDCRAGKAAH